MSDAQIDALLDAIKLVELREARVRRAAQRRQARLRDQAVRQAGQRPRRRDHQGEDRERTDACRSATRARSQVADQIVVIGYPGVADMKVLLDEKSQLQASVTDGAISSLKHATQRRADPPDQRADHARQLRRPGDDHEGQRRRARDVRQRERDPGLQLPRRVGDAEGADQGRARSSRKPSDTIKRGSDGLDALLERRVHRRDHEVPGGRDAVPAARRGARPDLASRTRRRRKARRRSPKASNTGSIVGGIVGGVVVSALLGFVAIAQEARGRNKPTADGRCLPARATGMQRPRTSVHSKCTAACSRAPPAQGQAGDADREDRRDRAAGPARTPWRRLARGARAASCTANGSR